MSENTSIPGMNCDIANEIRAGILGKLLSPLSCLPYGIVFINWTITLIMANIRQIASSPMCIHSCILSSLIPVMGLVGLVSLSGKRR